MDAQRVKVKTRWELARGREAETYGMGGWSFLTNTKDNNGLMAMSLRKAKDGRKDKKRTFLGR